MSNIYQTTTKVLGKAHAYTEANMAFVNSVRDAKYEKEFAVPGDKIGAVLHVPIENQIQPFYSNEFVETPIAETDDTITINNWIGAGVKNMDLDLVLSVNSPDSQFIKPCGVRVAEELEATYIQQALYDCAFQVGTDGTFSTSPNALTPFTQAREMLHNMKMESGGHHLLITTGITNTVIGANVTQYNPQKTISDEFTKGRLGQMAGFETPFESVLVRTLPTGTRTINSFPITAYTSTSITISGGASEAGNTIALGENFYINGCYMMTNNVQQGVNFWGCVAGASASAGATNTALVFDASGNLVVPINTYINVTGASQTISATPVGQNAVFQGSASSNYKFGLAYHPLAFSFVSVKQMRPAGAGMVDFMNKKGINMRFWADSNIQNSSSIIRIDTMSGMGFHKAYRYVPGIRVATAS